MRKLSGRLRLECVKADDMIQWRLGRPIADAFDMLRFMTDGTDVHKKGHVSFSYHYFVYYYFCKEMWREARECFYYAEELERINIRQKGKKDYYYSDLPYLPEELRYKTLSAMLENIEKDEWIVIREYKSYIKFFAYWRIKPFAPAAADLNGLLARGIAGWKKRIEEVRIEMEQMTRPPNWAEKMYWMFDPFAQYILLLLCAGQVDAIELELAPFVQWLEWTQQNKSRARFLSNPAGHFWRVADPRFLIPALQCWMTARRGPERRTELAAAAMKYWDKWFIDWHVKDATLIGLPDSTLLSIVMRIDLGLDLENCREFARYFKPYLTAFPHIAEKVAALDVEYEPPSGLMPREEIERLQHEYRVEIGRDPDTGASVFKYHERN